jgi:hypothetical protein
LHRRRPDQGALSPAQAEGAVDAAGPVELGDDPADSRLHQLHGCSPAAGVANRLEVVTGGLRHLLARDVGTAAGLAEDPGVDHQGLAAEGLYPLAHVGDLGPLRVEGPDGRYHRPVHIPTRLCKNNAELRGSSIC